jgi:xylulokinase
MNFLGIDIGTTSIKTAVFNEKLVEQISLTADYTLSSQGDTVEFDGEAYWTIVKGEIEKIKSKMPISALSVDTQCETLILTDENGTPTRPAIVWLDNRATKEAEIIENHFGRKKVYEITGQPEITATWPACKLLWVKRNEPDVWKKTKKVFLLEDWILYKMTGKFISERTLQSSTIYFNIHTGGWWDEMLSFIELDKEMLPSLHKSAEAVGEYEGIAVATGAIDQIAGAIGAGVVKPGLVSVMTGTTMVIFMPSEAVPAYDEKSIVPCHYNYDGKYCLLSWTPTAGMALKWLKNSLCENFSFDELNLLADAVNPGSDGLTFLPYLCGSTMPKYNPAARGSFTGLTTEHTRGHFVRAVMEAVACMLKSNLDYLGLDIDEIRAMGGAANSKLWCQIKADMTKKRLVTLKNKETACLGSAILAAVGVGYFDSVETAAKMIELDKSYESSGTDYSECYERYLAYDKLLNATE